MRRNIIILILFLPLAGWAQFYDGITQPTRYRFLMSTNNKGGAVMLNAYRYNVTPRLSATFNHKMVNFETHMLELWTNVSFCDKKLWFMSRTGFNIETGDIYETISGTWMATSRLHFDFTWFNFIDQRGLNFTEFGQNVNDNLQVLAGYKFWDFFVLNAGYRVRGEGSFITNFRLLVNDYHWVQTKYVHDDRFFALTYFIQFNTLWRRCKD